MTDPEDYKHSLLDLVLDPRRRWNLPRPKLDAIGWAIAEIGKSGRLAANLRATADRYEKDGEPGELSSTWGWRAIAEHLRLAAAEIERGE